MLLVWYPALKPSGPSGLAAIRFNSSVQPRSILIVPDGAAPFSHMPDVVGYVQLAVETPCLFTLIVLKADIATLVRPEYLLTLTNYTNH